MQVHYFAVCLKFGKMSMLSDLTATCCICPALSSVLLLLIREAGIHFCVVRAFYVSLKKIPPANVLQFFVRKPVVVCRCGKMSLFRRPKKPIQRRVFTSYDDDGDEDDDGGGAAAAAAAATERMDVDIIVPVLSNRPKKPDRSNNTNTRETTTAEKLPKKSSLLSFDDEGNYYLFPL